MGPRVCCLRLAKSLDPVHILGLPLEHPGLECLDSKTSPGLWALPEGTIGKQLALYTTSPKARFSESHADDYLAPFPDTVMIFIKNTEPAFLICNLLSAL